MEAWVWIGTGGLSKCVCVCELRHNDLGQGRGGQRGWIGESRGKAGHP